MNSYAWLNWSHLDRWFIQLSYKLKHYIMKTGTTQKLQLKAKRAKFLIMITIFIVKFIYIYCIYKATMIANNFIVVIYVWIFKTEALTRGFKLNIWQPQWQFVYIWIYIYIYIEVFLHLQYILSTILHFDIVSI